jgi:hypothetical protein
MILLSKYTLSEAATISSISAYHSSSATSWFKLLIYDDDGAGGLPGTLLGYSLHNAQAALGSPTWVTLDLVTPAELSAGDYWLGWQHSNGNTNLNEHYNASGTSYYTTDVTYVDGDPPVATCPSGGTSGTRAWAVYATYPDAPGFTGLTVTKILNS